MLKLIAIVAATGTVPYIILGHEHRDSAATISAVLITIAIFFLSRTESRNKVRKRNKIDIAELLETIEHTDTLLLYWQDVVQGKFEEFAGESKQNSVEYTISTLTRIRDALLPMLDQAHNKTPLDDKQREILRRARNELKRHLIRDEGQPIKTVGLSAIPQPVLQTPKAKPYPKTVPLQVATVGSKNEQREYRNDYSDDTLSIDSLHGFSAGHDNCTSFSDSCSSDSSGNDY